MKFCIITHVVHTEKEGKFYAYAPYVNEMNLWNKYVDEVLVVAPLSNFSISPIHQYYKANQVDFIAINSFDTLSYSALFKTIFAIPYNIVKIFSAMKNADHIHLRCPGNIGLLGCIIQIFFPSKAKTAKYAGNWDPKSKQPLSYNIQKWILSNTFLTKNMKVLVYGEWENQSKNIKPFFTATYAEQDKEPLKLKPFSQPFKFVFVGTLSPGKQPIYAIKLVESLQKKGFEVCLDLFGEGAERKKLEAYIENNNLQKSIILKGNQSSEIIKKAYLDSHFLILPSKSEGWPKVVAEAMFWGCLPIATSISCLPSMLNEGERGLLLSEDLNADTDMLSQLLQDEKQYQIKINNAINWSRMFTIDTFENELKLLLQK